MSDEQLNADDESKLVKLLGLRSDDSRLWHTLDALGMQKRDFDENLVKDSNYRWIEYKNAGISLMFSRIYPEHATDDAWNAAPFRLVAFHLLAEDVEGFREFRGRLKGDVHFGDTDEQVESKLGPPSIRGGGVDSTVIKRAKVPNWVKYVHRTHFVHCQFNQSGHLEMITLEQSSSSL